MIRRYATAVALAAMAGAALAAAAGVALGLADAVTDQRATARHLPAPLPNRRK